jgi:hypothetical protein
VKALNQSIDNIGLTMTNYQSAIKRIKQADTIEKLKSLDKSFDRIHQAGFLTDSELTQLDHKIFTKTLSVVTQLS